MYYDPSVLKTIPDCHLAIGRAIEAGADVFVRPLYVRLAQLGGENYSDPLEANFYSSLAVYEQTLVKKRAVRIRIKLGDLGGGITAVEQILTDWSRKKAMSSGFRRLVELDLRDQLGEYIVGISFPERFPDDVVKAARKKLLVNNVMTAEELSELLVSRTLSR